MVAKVEVRIGQEVRVRGGGQCGGGEPGEGAMIVVDICV
jgi:hypothetical protein